MTFRLRGLGQRQTEDTQRRLAVAVGGVGEGLQHPDLQHAAITSGVGGRIVQPAEQGVDRRGPRRRCGRDVRVLPGAVPRAFLRQQQPGQGQVLVLVQKVQVLLIKVQRPFSRPVLCSVQVAGGDLDSSLGRLIGRTSG